eukprot:TRINITY_DN11284_c0_g1_i1.p1 TRINITY_DN11284_c0_g1~~TRINITY_DN11284_c0_g1_i1.p1  ORF type:complete len:305 (-),score=66.80 TRINITY_DN11284_c0_g1_i1:67-981(-)
MGSSQSHWTEANIPSLTGKTALVTGSNIGLGYETARQFMAHGAHVVLACRSLDKANAAAETLKQGGYPGTVSVHQLDLSDLDQVAESAKSLSKTIDKLDILVLNAAVMNPPLSQTKQGFELQFGVNHLGHFAFTLPLLPLLKKAEGSRIVVVSSTGSTFTDGIDFDDLDRTNTYGNGVMAYAESKGANLLFARQLQTLLDKDGAKSPLVVSSHPGASSTNLARHWSFGDWWLPLFAMKVQQGALSQIRASVDPAVGKFEYYGPHWSFTGYPVVTDPPAYCKDDKLATKLWEFSEEKTGVKYDDY